jgi:hypothetical protein
MEVTKCLGCDELFFGAGECPDCVRLDALYESRRLAKRRLLDEQERAELISKLPRTDIGMVFYAGVKPPPHWAAALALLLGAVLVLAVLGAVVAAHLLGWAAWHYGKLLIVLLAGAQ